MAKPKITETEVTTEVTRRHTVTGADPIPRPYQAGQIVPQSVVVVFVDGDWQTAAITGPIVKKDGSPGPERTNRYYGCEELPEWMLPLIKPGRSGARVVEGR